MHIQDLSTLPLHAPTKVVQLTTASRELFQEALDAVGARVSPAGFLDSEVKWTSVRYGHPIMLAVGGTAHKVIAGDWLLIVNGEFCIANGELVRALYGQS